MARRIDPNSLKAIETVVAGKAGYMSVSEIAEALAFPQPRRTLQYRLKSLVDRNRLIKKGSGRGARYCAAEISSPAGQAATADVRFHARQLTEPPLSKKGAEVLDDVSRPLSERRVVGYDRLFLDQYQPNASFYLSEQEREELRKIGETQVVDEPAGTHAKEVMNRFLIDLAWNSSRLEGNTYSLLDTVRLIETSEAAEGKSLVETQMIINHKLAIENLVEDAEIAGFDRHTICNLHAALADNLLLDPLSPGRLRTKPVGIHGSAYHPINFPQLIEECFDIILRKASLVEDPFEQAFFVLVHLPYLQPFEDVNKRASRISTSIPFIKANLSPLSFVDVPRDLYVKAVLGVYELRRTELLRDLFLWAYQRSALRYARIGRLVGEPDPFRLLHGAAMRQVVGDVIRRRMDKKDAGQHIADWARDNIGEADRDRFRNFVEQELLSLHEGNFALYRVRPSEFAAWQTAWDR